MYLLRYKSEATENLVKYISEIEAQKEIKIKRVRCDNGCEFTAIKFKQFCQEKGISIEYTQPYSSQQNGVSERMNRTLYDKARTMMIETGLPKYLWVEAILCAAYQLNRCPSAAINYRIPAQMYIGKLRLNELKVFGSKAWAVILPKNQKLEERAQEVRMVGYAKNGYRLWNSISDKLISSRDVKFDETQIKYKEPQRETKDGGDEVRIYNEETYERQSEDENIIETTEQTEETTYNRNEESQNDSNETITTRTTRKIKKPQHLNDYELYTVFCLTV